MGGRWTLMFDVGRSLDGRGSTSVFPLPHILVCVFILPRASFSFTAIFMKSGES